MNKESKMFISRLRINQQSFVNILNVSNNLFFRKSQNFSFPLHKGNVNVCQDNNMLHLKYEHHGILKSFSSQIYELQEGKFVLSIPCQDYECVLTTTRGAYIKINWDNNDDLKNITLYNNDSFDQILSSVIGEVPSFHFKKE
jgi:hypothetical protein